MRIQLSAVLIGLSMASTAFSQSSDSDSDAWWNTTLDNVSSIDNAKDSDAEINFGTVQQNDSANLSQVPASGNNALKVRDLSPVRSGKPVSADTVPTSSNSHVKSMAGEPFAGFHGPSHAGNNLLRFMECGEQIGHDAWRGYAQQRQSDLARQYAHVYGTCGCFEGKCGRHGKGCCGGKKCGSKGCSGLYDHVCVGKDCGHGCGQGDRVNRYRQRGHHGHGRNHGHRLFKCNHGGCSNGSVCGQSACGQVIATPPAVSACPANTQLGNGCSNCGCAAPTTAPVIMSQRPAPITHGRVATGASIPRNTTAIQHSLVPIPVNGRVASGLTGQNIPR